MVKATRMQGSLKRASRTNGARDARGAPQAVLWLAMLAAMISVWVGFSPAARAEQIKAQAELTKEDGFARLVIQFAQDVEAEAKLSGQILVISFKRPIDIATQRLPESAPDYMAAARRDPDGSAIRIALRRKVTINTMVAGERFYIDLMPEGWSGPPPALPQEVVRELAERARVAERKLREQNDSAPARKPALVRVRIGNQPTFSRYVFEVPGNVKGEIERNDDKLSVTFDRVMTFDLSEPTADAPPQVTAIGQQQGEDTSSVNLTLVGEVETTSFREDSNFVVDVRFKPKKAAAGQQAGAPARPEVKPEAKDESKPAAPPAAKEAAIPAPASAPAAMTQAPAAKPEPEVKIAAQPHPVPVQSMPATAKQDAPAVQTMPAMDKPAPMQASPQSHESAAVPAPNVSDAPERMDAKAEPGPADARPQGTIDVRVDRSGERTTLKFPFAKPTPAAMFRRGEFLWTVFDTKDPIDFKELTGEAGKAIVEVHKVDLRDGTALRFRLAKPYLASLTQQREEWLMSIGDNVADPAEPLTIQRNIVEAARANIAIPFVEPARFHQIVDPNVGDTIDVVSAIGPVRGFIKQQNLVGLQILHSMHGIAVVPLVDNIKVELASDKVMIGQPGGLVLSATVASLDHAAVAVKATFDPDEWRANVKAIFGARLEELMREAAAAAPDKVNAARMKLARFYIAKGMAPEAKGVMDVVLSTMKRGEEDPEALILRAVTSILFDRPDQALTDLRNPAVGSSYDSQLWKAMIYARQQKWADAREKFKDVEFAISALPIDLQRLAVMDAMRAALEVKDYESAGRRSNELEIVGLDETMRPVVTILRGRLAESLGRTNDALAAYKSAIASNNRMASAEAEVRLTALELARKDITPEMAVDKLEGLAVTWRGDDTEMRTLQMLFGLYAEASRYRDALNAARSASNLQPNSEVTRAIQNDAQALFTSIFLDGKAKQMSVVDTLTMFYEFRDLTPIGRRGDELIRRLSDRLASADLLDQATELLQYQVDHRLQGAARAQVATRLSMLYLMSRKPDRAIAVLQKSRISNLATELRQLRLLLEARAQSDVGRHDLALDIISNVPGREAIRLRSDIYWAARRWRESAEQIELMYGDRWRNEKPLTKDERSDILRAAIGYSIAEDAIGQARFADKYRAKMANGESAKVFAMVAERAPEGMSNIAEISRVAASFDTLGAFLREMRARYPEVPNVDQPDSENKDAAPTTTGTLPAMPIKARAASPPHSKPATARR